MKRGAVLGVEALKVCRRVRGGVLVQRTASAPRTDCWPCWSATGGPARRRRCLRLPAELSSSTPSCVPGAGLVLLMALLCSAHSMPITLTPEERAAVDAAIAQAARELGPDVDGA